jgi:predicted CXXCH cytochrome family protein
MRTLKLAFLALAAATFATPASAQPAKYGMGAPPTGIYQPNLAGIPNNTAADNLNFHAGGVAACDGCHVMHNASSGVAKSTRGLPPGELAWSNHVNAYLLQGSDQSSTCLNCHGDTVSNTNQFSVASINPAGTPFFYSPAGDFGWLYKNYNNSPAQRHGHNVQARDFGLPADPDLTNAPGGTWQPVTGDPLGQFACSSCHDPHGRYRMQVGATPNGIQFAGPYAGSPPVLPIASTGSYGAVPTATYSVGSYRLLAGQRYSPASTPGYPFSNDPPVAVAPTSYNHAETTALGEVRVAYGTGMSEWCQNCHVNIHNANYTSGWTGLRHPAGSTAYLRASQFNVYNTYVSSGVLNPALTSNYTSLVPFEQGPGATLAALQANANPTAVIAAGATTTVMCLTCHRAHASAFDSMVRWDQNATFLTDGANVTAGITAAAAVTGSGGPRPAADTTAGYYGRNMITAFGPYQRSLCNKCHAKD